MFCHAKPTTISQKGSFRLAKAYDYIMANYKIALVPGSFDPPTAGHYDIVERAAAMFGKVYVTAFVNSSKAGRFTPEQRLEMLKAAFGRFDNVVIDISDELLADYAEERGIGTVIKGARNATDFDYEMSLSLINRSISPSLDTVILPAKSEHIHISSTMVSELIKYGKDYSAVVPAGVAELIKKYGCR